jgi:ABC-type antimicrobial peptide transport system permease subunit
MFASSFISQIFAFIVAALILNIFVYDSMDSFYFTRNIVELSPFFALAFVITSMVVAFLALWLIRKEKLMEALNQEV